MYLFWQKQRVHNTETPNTLRKTGRWLGSSSILRPLYCLTAHNVPTQVKTQNLLLRFTFDKLYIHSRFCVFDSHQGRAQAQRTVEFQQKTVPYCSPEHIVIIIIKKSPSSSSEHHHRNHQHQNIIIINIKHYHHLLLVLWHIRGL